MMNLVAFNLCAASAVINAYRGDVGTAVLMLVLGMINLLLWVWNGTGRMA